VSADTTGLRYTRDHEWTRRESGGAEVTVGITDYAQDALGDIVFVELPAVGRRLAQGESAAEVESTKTVAQVLAPVAGEVTAVNEALTDHPETVNTDPYGAGWFFRLRADDPAGLDGLMDEAAYGAHVEEVSR
jgi:glycine cleavage system H protein